MPSAWPGKSRMKSWQRRSASSTRLYAARVPVRVRPNIWRVAASLLFFGAGVLLHIFAAKVEEKTKIRANISELIGTVLLLVTLGEFVSRFLKFNKALQEYEHPQPPKP